MYVILRCSDCGLLCRWKLRGNTAQAMRRIWNFCFCTAANAGTDKKKNSANLLFLVQSFEKWCDFRVLLDYHLNQCCLTGRMRCKLISSSRICSRIRFSHLFRHVACQKRFVRPIYNLLTWHTHAHFSVTLIGHAFRSDSTVSHTRAQTRTYRYNILKWIVDNGFTSKLHIFRNLNAPETLKIRSILEHIWSSSLKWIFYNFFTRGPRQRSHMLFSECLYGVSTYFAALCHLTLRQRQHINSCYLLLYEYVDCLGTKFRPDFRIDSTISEKACMTENSSVQRAQMNIWAKFQVQNSNISALHGLCITQNHVISKQQIGFNFRCM